MRFPSSHLASSATATVAATVLVAAALGVLAPRQAAAKPSFVEVIANHLSLSYQPPCRLCHVQGTTGAGTIQTPFGMSMLARGLTVNQSTVTAALDALAADATDSDADGVSDIDELRADKDPNTPADVALSAAGPDFGCSVTPSGPARHDGARAWSAAIVVAITVAWRRRKRPAPR